MQILQWLSKLSQEPPRASNSSAVIDEKQVDKDHKVRSKDIGSIRRSRLKGVEQSGLSCGNSYILSSSSPVIDKKQVDKDRKVNKSKDIGSIRRSRLKRVEQSGLSCGNSYIFKFVRIKDVSKSYFYHTLNLKTLGRSFDSMKMKKEDVAATTANNVGNKVLPITESSQSSANTGNEQCPKVEKKEKTKGDMSKTLSRMKDLLRWAAAAKAEKGGKYIGRKVLLFKNRMALKAVPDDVQLNDDESPKISFRWDMESCSTTTSSVYSALKRDLAGSVNSTPLHVRDQWVARSGSWVTTDSEFVVLEL